MTTHKKGPLLAMGVSLLLLLSACGSFGGSSQTALQVLQQSVTAMKQLKTAHIGMNFTIHLSNTSGTTSSLNTATVTLAGNGDEILPDKFSASYSIGTGTPGTSFSLAMIMLGNQLYGQKPQGPWYVIDKSNLSSSQLSIFTQTKTENYNALLTVAQKAHFKDFGDQKLHGQSLRHITVTFSKNDLQQLLNTVGQLPSGTSQQTLQQALSMVNMQKATLDLWVDEATDYIHQLELKMDMSIDLGSGSSSSSAVGTAAFNFDMLVDYSRFNAPVTIAAPANAIPTSDPTKIFQSGSN